jgi:hypothetical protein
MIAATWPAGAPPLENILLPLEPDVRVMVFLAAMAVVSAVLITLAPAGRLAGMRLTQASRGEASPDRHGSRLRSGLVAMQIGACALFLIGAVGLAEQSSRLANPPLNLSYERVSTLRIDTAVRLRCDTTGIGACGAVRRRRVETADGKFTADNRSEGIDNEHRDDCRVHGRVA